METSTLTGVSRKQRENKNTCQTHQRVVVLNTDHKDVALVTEFKPHLHKGQAVSRSVKAEGPFKRGHYRYCMATGIFAPTSGFADWFHVEFTIT